MSFKKIQVSFVIDENNTKLTKLLAMTKKEFFSLSDKIDSKNMLGRKHAKRNSKIISDDDEKGNNTINTGKKKNNNNNNSNIDLTVINLNESNEYFSESSSKDNSSSSRKLSSRNIKKIESISKNDNKRSSKLNKKKKNESDDESADEISSDTFDDEIDESNEDTSDIDKQSSNIEYNAKSRRVINNNELEEVELPNKKSKKKELTEEDIIKKNNMIIKRREEMRQKQEEEKKKAIEKILNDEGRKQREKQRKIQEENVKKEKSIVDKIKQSYNCIRFRIKDDKRLIFPTQDLYKSIFENFSNKKTKDFKTEDNGKCTIFVDDDNEINTSLCKSLKTVKISNGTINYNDSNKNVIKV